MDTAEAISTGSALPAQRTDAFGQKRVSLWAIVSLAAPFLASSAVQMVLALTDTWFIGHISTSALAAMAAIQLPIVAIFSLFSGVGLGGQTIVAQAFGGGRHKRAAQAAWTGVWASMFIAPAFAVIGWYGHDILRPFGLDPEVEALAIKFWQTYMIGAPLGVAVSSVLGFFNGVGQPRITFAVVAFVATSNAVLAPLFIFKLGWGIGGAAWATNCAQALGLVAALYIFMSPKISCIFFSRLMWRLRAERLWSQWKLGFPMGLLFAANALGSALFQLMQVHLSPVDGAASQVVVMFVMIGFMPAAGIAIAGSTLVGQSIGMGDRSWARKIGNTIILICMSYMGCVGLLLGLCSPWLIPMFVSATDPLAPDVVRVGVTIMWIAAAYQFFDGLQVGSSFCLRGAGDAVIPAGYVIVLSWFFFVPFAHMLTFERGSGWVDWLPQFGLGVTGGWIAALSHMAALGVVLALRWHSPAWENIRLR